jgi:predicted nucleic acid-binding protein
MARRRSSRKPIVSEVWVTNASPVITLAKAGYLELLAQLPGELLLPEAVALEILAGPTGDAARQALEGGWGRRVAPATVPPELIEWGLDAGETAALALALERAPCTVVLDDKSARTCAKACRLSLIGTLGVVLRAKKRGLVPDAAEVLRALVRAGLHLDDRVIRLALGQVGETWSAG